MKTRLSTIILIFWSLPALATTIDFTASNLGGTTWQFDYTVTNDTLSVDIEEFTIYFDYTLYDNLSVGPGQPAGWDSIVIQPDSGLPDDGFFDSLALAGGIASGDSLGGFSLIVDYLGTGLPVLQAWEVVDPNSFVTLDSGTSSGTFVTTVPEPVTFWLLAVGLAAATAAVRRRA